MPATAPPHQRDVRAECLCIAGSHLGTPAKLKKRTKQAREKKQKRRCKGRMAWAGAYFASPLGGRPRSDYLLWPGISPAHECRSISAMGCAVGSRLPRCPSPLAETSPPPEPQTKRAKKKRDTDPRDRGRRLRSLL